MGRSIAGIAFTILLGGLAAANAPPPPPDRSAPDDAVSAVHDTVAGIWDVTIESLVGPEPDPKTGTLNLTWSGRYFLAVTNERGKATSDEGVWAVWDAAEGGSFVVMLAPIAPGDGDPPAFGGAGPQRLTLTGDGAGGYRGEASFGAHQRRIVLKAR